MKLINQKGSLLLEALICSFVLGTVLIAFLSSYLDTVRNSRRIQTSLATNAVVTRISDEIINSLQASKITYNSAISAATALDVSALPLAWDNGRMSTIESCPTCRGRYGYIVQPYEEFRGLYKVTLRMTHPDWESKVPNYLEYTFVASSR